MALSSRTRHQSAAKPMRSQQRVPSNFRVEVLGVDTDGNRFQQAATTLDLSLFGAKITGLAARLNRGDTVILGAGEARSRFKVSWIKSNQDGTYQLGVRCLESDKCLWQDWLMARLNKQRERLPCTGTAKLHPMGFADPILGKLRNIDADGCFVQCVTESPLVGTMQGEFVIDGIQFNAMVAACESHRKIGVRLQWCDLGSGGQARLHAIVDELKLRQSIEHIGPEN